MNTVLFSPVETVTQQASVEIEFLVFGSSAHYMRKLQDDPRTGGIKWRAAKGVGSYNAQYEFVPASFVGTYLIPHATQTVIEETCSALFQMIYSVIPAHTQVKACVEPLGLIIYPQGK